MVRREYWIKRIEDAWLKKSVVWLAGVRRAGKTKLCKSLEGVVYFDCESPAVRAQLADPDAFLKKWNGKRLVLDEIHVLNNPSQLLKLAADHFPKTQIVATGSSTLSATAKFRDTLTDRYVLVNLTPMLSKEGALFGNDSLDHRMLFGGLPPFFMEETLEEVDFRGWLTSFWAKDILELFRVLKRASFLSFVELLFARSGGMFEATSYARECEVSRSTITNYLFMLETTFVAHILKPYSKHAATEIKSAPKVYAFDTGFVCHAKGWYSLRNEDYGFLWEHIVLNELLGRLVNIRVKYWRDRYGNEIDFVVEKNRHLEPIAIECKWSYRTFNPSNLRVFRRRYPDGKNFVVCAQIDGTYVKGYDDLEVTFISLENLIEEIKRIGPFR